MDLIAGQWGLCRAASLGRVLAKLGTQVNLLESFELRALERVCCSAQPQRGEQLRLWG